MERGDVLVLYTDGITEAADEQGTMYGTERLIQCVTALRESDPEAILQGILAEVTSFSNKESFDDDVSVIVMKLD
jgi:sigma-B regulation protein RsbU (phosphoserine phosphatase)